MQIVLGLFILCLLWPIALVAFGSPVGILLSVALLRLIRSKNIRIAISIFSIVLFVYILIDEPRCLLDVDSIYRKYFSLFSLISNDIYETLIFLRGNTIIYIIIYAILPTVVYSFFSYTFFSILSIPFASKKDRYLQSTDDNNKHVTHIPIAHKKYEKTKESFEDRYGPLVCDGKNYRCLRNRPCAHSDSLFCQKVMLEIFTIGSFRAQFPILLPSGVRYFDFAFLTQENTPVVIEVDDFGSHSKNRDQIDFAYELKRQNEIILAGWKILRFPLDQIDKNPKQCADYILKMNPQTDIHIIESGTPGKAGGLKECEPLKAVEYLSRLKAATLYNNFN